MFLFFAIIPICIWTGWDVKWRECPICHYFFMKRLFASYTTTHIITNAALLFNYCLLNRKMGLIVRRTKIYPPRRNMRHFLNNAIGRPSRKFLCRFSSTWYVKGQLIFLSFGNNLLRLLHQLTESGNRDSLKCVHIEHGFFTATWSQPLL